LKELPIGARSKLF